MRKFGLILSLVFLPALFTEARRSGQRMKQNVEASSRVQSKNVEKAFQDRTMVLPREHCNSQCAKDASRHLSSDQIRDVNQSRQTVTVGKFLNRVPSMVANVSQSGMNPKKVIAGALVASKSSEGWSRSEQQNVVKYMNRVSTENPREMKERIEEVNKNCRSI